MRVGLWCTGVIFLISACATSFEQSLRRPVVSVISPWSTIYGVSDDRAVAASQGIDVDEVVLNLFCVEDIEHIPGLLTALVERGDSIIVGLGRPVLPAMIDVAERNRRRTFYWIGWGPPQTDLPSEIRTWWADPDSLQEIVAELVVQQNSQGEVILVGDAVSHSILSLLQRNKIVVEQHAIAESTAHRTREEWPAMPRPFFVLERPRYTMYGREDRVYWAAEGPPGAESGIRAELHTNWLGALADALNWHFDRGGIPPGTGTDRWLTLKLSESGGDST